MDEEGLRRTNM